MPPHTYHPLCKATSSTISRILIFPVTSTRSKISSHSFLFYEIARSLKIIEAYKNNISNISNIRTTDIKRESNYLLKRPKINHDNNIFFENLIEKSFFYIR